MIAVWFIIALCLDRVLLKMTARTYDLMFAAGYGSIDLVQRKTADRLIGQRILVPALIYWIERLLPCLKPHRLTALYEPLRILALTAALWMTAHAIGVTGALIIAALLPATFLFDFWDFPYELLGFAAGLTGDLRLAILCAGIHALARPFTAPLVALCYGLVTGDLVGAGLVLLAVGLGVIPGWTNTTCAPVWQKFGLWRVNIQDVRELFQNRPFYLSEIFMTMGLTALVLWAVFSGNAGAAWPIPLALVVVQWTLPRAAETRSLAPALLWVVLAFRGGI